MACSYYCVNMEYRRSGCMGSKGSMKEYGRAMSNMLCQVLSCLVTKNGWW
jgi:hypothetical protein